MEPATLVEGMFSFRVAGHITESVGEWIQPYSTPLLVGASSLSTALSGEATLALELQEKVHESQWRNLAKETQHVAAVAFSCEPPFWCEKS
ncbi:unnamed protein product [Caretta caretta]